MKERRYITVLVTILLIQSVSVTTAAWGSDLLSVPCSLELTRPLGGREKKLASVFNREKDFKIAGENNSEEILRLRGDRIISHRIMPADGSSAPYRVSGDKKKNMAISIIASAVFPGLGEMYMYTRSGKKSVLARAIGLIAVETYLWYGYFDNHDRGKDFKRRYEEYGDAHWSEERFLENHPICYDNGGCETWEEYNYFGSSNETYSSPNWFYFYYTAKEVDREEYYENMGKYDAFLYGWDDWNGEYLHLGGEPNYWTPHRTYYWDLRQESNKYLLRADYHIMGMIANRVISMVHAGWIAYSHGNSPEDWSLELNRTPLDYKCSLNYRF